MFFKNKHINTEDELLKAAEGLKSGSAEAFHILYGEYSLKVYRYCLRMLEDTAQAEDAFQETFVRVFEKRDSFNGVSFQAWLFAIARNCCYNTLRSRKNDIVRFEEDFQNGYEMDIEDVGMKLSIEQALAKLPVSLREAIILREYEECTYQEIATILNIELSAVKIRVFRARVLLKKLLNSVVKELNES